MPISARRMVTDFYQQLQTTVGGQQQDIKVVDAVRFINRAYELWFESKVDAAEKSSKVRDDLRLLEVKKKCIKCKKVDNECCFAEYPDTLYRKLNQYATASNDCCSKPKNIIIRMFQSDDLNEARKSPFFSSDFGYERLIGDEAGRGLYVYHDGAMLIDKVCIDYYKKITYIQCPSLVDCEDGYFDYDDSKITKDVDFEIDSTYAVRDVVNLAVYLAAGDKRDTIASELQLKSILTGAQLHKLN